jgi:RNA polymerase sigma-70 factor, ECF subfamily
MPTSPSSRGIVDAFLAASRNGDFEGLLAVLDPDVVVRADDAAIRLGGSHEARGAQAVAKAFMGRAQSARSALLDGVVGAVVAPRGRLLLVLDFTIADGKIVGIDAVADPERLRAIDLSALDER